MASARKSFITGPIPRYRKLYEGPRYEPKSDEDWNPDLPYGGKIYLARKKKPQGWITTLVEGLFIVLVVAMIYTSYYYIDHMHLHATRAVAYMGYPNALHFMGQRYLNGNGVDKSCEEAMKYFNMAAAQGHPHASHNAGVGHLKGCHKLPPGEAHRLIQHAAVNGVPEAQDTLNDVCINGGCQ